MLAVGGGLGAGVMSCLKTPAVVHVDLTSVINLLRLPFAGDWQAADRSLRSALAALAVAAIDAGKTLEAHLAALTALTGQPAFPAFAVSAVDAGKALE